MPNYRYLLDMTEEAGMLQFARNGAPDPHSGYTLDDNARALLVALNLGEKGYPYADRYLRFLEGAQRPDGSWSNFLLDGEYSSQFDSEDSIGRAIMACGIATRSSWRDGAARAGHLMSAQLDALSSFRFPRGIAYSLVGLCKCKLPGNDKKVAELVSRLSAKLIDIYSWTRSPDWRWFENNLTYCNGILPQALFCVYSFKGDKKCLTIAQESLDFLNDIVFRTGYLNIIGNQGWYQRGGRLPLFDQQPVDAASMAFACREAYEATGQKDYMHLAELAHQWYRGKNVHNMSLYDKNSGGCYDALTADGVNRNQGAEAVLSLLLTDQLMQGSMDVGLDYPQPAVKTS